MTNTNEPVTMDTANLNVSVANGAERGRKKRKVISRSKLSQNSNIKRKLKCVNTNTHSLQFKMDKLKQVIKDNDVQVVAVT